MPPAIEVLLRFDDPGEAARWAAIDDVVMGGTSASTLSASGDGTAVFSGEVSLERGGGFASVRSAPRDWAFAGARGVALRVRGDGKIYKLNLRTDDALDGVTWQAPFTPAGREWATVLVDFGELEPRWRGRAVRGAGPFRPESVRTVGFLVSDRQAGPFRMELAWIGAFR